MIHSLKLITPPATEPVTVADVKLHTHIDYDVEDNIISTWISSARIIAEDYQRRAYIGQQWELGFDYFPELPISFPRAPLIGVISIKYYDYLNAETILYSSADDPITTTEETETTPETNSNFFVDIYTEPGRLDFQYSKSWPSVVLRDMSALKIRFACGYGLDADNVPQNVKDAIYLYCAYRNENRSAEIESAPKQFFNLLNPNRLYLQ